MALHKKLRFKLHPKHGGSTAKKACTPLVSDCAMKVPVVVLHKLNLELDHQSSKLSVKEPDHRLCTNQDRQEVRALGKRKAHDKMALSPAAQSTLLPRSTDFTRSHDLQDFDHKTICRKQLKVLLVRTNLDTKNQLERQATDDDDSDHEDVRPTDGSHLNVQHENQEEQSTDDSDSDQFDEQDLEELSPYERQRLKNIKHNAKFLKSINLLEAASGLCPKKKRTLVKRERSQTVRLSSRLQGIPPALLKLEGRKRPGTKEKFGIPPSSVSMFPENDVDHGAWITFQDTWKSISKGEFAKPSSYECRDLSSYANELKSLTVEKTAKMFSGFMCSIAVHPSNARTLVAAGDRNGVIGLWDMNRQSAGVYKFPLHSRTASVAFSPSNAEHLLSAGLEGTIRCGDITRCVFDKIYHGKEKISSFDFLSADSSVLIVSHHCSKLSVVDRRTPPNACDVRGSLHLNIVRTVNVHPLARDLCLVAGDRSALIYDARKLSATRTQPVMSLRGHKNHVFSAYYSPGTGNHVATSSKDDHIRIFRIKDMETTYPIKSIGNELKLSSKYLVPVVWDPKQENCFGQSQFNNEINIFHMNGQLVHTLSSTSISSMPLVYAFHPTRDLIVAGTVGGRALVWKKRKQTRCT